MADEVEVGRRKEELGLAVTEGELKDKLKIRVILCAPRALQQIQHGLYRRFLLVQKYSL